MNRLDISLVATFLGLLFVAGAAQTAYAQGGHGPVFGLATPTLPQGAWNVDVTLMSVGRTERAVMTRETIRYGLTPNLQLNVSIPQNIREMPAPPRTRIGTMMAGMGDAEISGFWRFHVQYPGVGQRFESTLMLGALYPMISKRGSVDVGPGGHLAAVTGYASRTVYAWLGGGIQSYLERDGDRPGDLRYVSAVAAWRPPVFQGDYPKPDWRIFVESLFESVTHDRIDGFEVDASGGERLFVGPTVLGLYGKWGIGAGVLFPVYHDLNGGQIGEDARYTINLSYWI